MAVRKSIQFLPEIFRTETNKKFLNATIDQLISEPNLKKINGYIGRKLAPSYKNTDSYIEEIDTARENYQLEPSIVLKNEETGNIEFVTTYADILNKINFYGGSSENQNRLFDNEFYTYNPSIDLDKFINFSQYFWLENGPSSVLVSASNVPLRQTFTVTYDSVSETYTFSGYGDVRNPTITLARGGVYQFDLNSPGLPFFIQTKPGTEGVNPAISSLSTRNVLGVTNNGRDTGIVGFVVPEIDEQNEWLAMDLVDTVDYATALSYKQVQGASIEELNFQYGGLDGYTTGIDNKKIIFINNDLIDSEFWTENNVIVSNGIAYFDNFDIESYDETEFENTTTVEFGKRNDVYKIQLTPDSLGVQRIVLILDTEIQDEQKINVRAGQNYAGTMFYSRLSLLNAIPSITAPLEVLFYQNGEVSNAVGGIRIVEPVENTIDPDAEIIGLPQYRSPNGVTFTNGLKITFDANATEPYKNNTYYVEGVGTAIRLIKESDLICYELNNIVDTPDYFTIKRSSIDQNAWTRSNRWFHKDIIQVSAEYNGTDPIFDQDLRAKRPIIEFDSNLQLFNNGREAKAPVDILENDIVTNAYRQVQGVVSDDPSTYTFKIQAKADELVIGKSYTITFLGTTDWTSIGAAAPVLLGDTFVATAVGEGTGTVESVDEITIQHDSRVIFAIDLNDQVRNKIYDVQIVEAEIDAFFDPVYKIYIEEAADAQVEEGHCVAVNSGTNGSKQWHYNGENWITSQLKTAVNQAPLFDVIDRNGSRFSDTSVYNASTFTGTKIFSYKESSQGRNDSVLGFPLSYKNFVSQGDIEFNNDFDIDEFNYLLDSGTQVSVAVNSGLLQKNIDRESHIRTNIWTVNQTFSSQYQIYSYVFDGSTNLFPIEQLPDASQNIPNIKVYINNQFIKNTGFFTAQIVDTYAVSIDPDLLQENDSVFILIKNSGQVLQNAYYEVPKNYDINSLNSNLSSLTLGQMRNHLITLSNNNLQIIGDVPGDSNLRDIRYDDTIGSILQHSAPLIYAGLFLNHPTMNFIDSVQLASREYTKFKSKFIDLSTKLDIDRDNISEAVDIIMKEINKIKNQSFPWYYSDMLPYGDNEKTVLPDYIIFNPDITSYEITSIFDDTKLSNKSVLVYLTRNVNNNIQKTLLLKDIDYFFNTDRPAITFSSSFKLLYNDIISIVEYNNTDGCFVPETPTKLGLYPKFTPTIFEDNTYRQSINVIQGHDGSITPCFNDFRDDLLLELERRIYNNLKTTYNSQIFDNFDYIPGKFRTTDYSLTEFNQILSRSFLSWVGTNKVDYTSNKYFVAGDPFTWNYKNFVDGINAETLPGTWRAVFKYFYDTDRPHTHPWEMLGFSEKPDYWDDRYGPAPYTGGNYILWSDCSIGYIAGGERAGFDVRYQRPNLMFIIPVDDSGNLKPLTEIGGAGVVTYRASELVTGEQYTIATLDGTDFTLVGAANNNIGTNFVATGPTTGNGSVTQVVGYSLVANFDSAKASASYSVGDIGPAESSWRRSSDYPFALCQTLSLLKPAKFFSLFSDVKRYRRSLVTGQFEVEGTGQHITPQAIYINGYVNAEDNVERSASYINWIRDYIVKLGIIDASTLIKNNLEKLSVQLSYKVGGYTDKKYLEILAEQSSPSSINDSVIIPEENYKIELYKGSPVDKISYSAVVVEKTSNGYTVYGYDTLNPYFYIVPSLANNNSYSISVGDQRAVIYKNFKKTKLAVPYGFEFNTSQQVIDFLVGYQRYLQAKGFVFDEFDSDLGYTKDWILSCKEFLNWINQGWTSGSVIVLSPASTKLKVFDDSAIVDEITNTPYGSKVLDINAQVITKNNFTVSREDNIFTFTSILDQTIGFATFNLIQYEHILLLDNVTEFQDIIYLPELGNRQFRLKLVGAKTSSWSGSLELPGFVYNNNKIDEWLPNKDYFKGTIILHKSRYYTALQNIIASDKFQTTQWQILDQSEFITGMIKNFATNAKQNLNFYDINEQPIDESLQEFSNALIGFRNRDYFNRLGIDPTTQSKFYQGLIKQKGSLNSVNALTGAKFNNLNTSINVYENWAIRVGTYGSTDVNKFIEVILNESSFIGNPALIQFTGKNYTAQENIVNYTVDEIYKAAGNYDDKLFKTESNDEPKLLRPLPVAGYVNLNDVDATLFDLNDYSTLTTIINSVGTGFKIWVARNFDNNWAIYRCNIIKGTAFALRYKVNNLAEIICNLPHNLSVADVVALKNFDSRYDGFYKVTNIVDSTRFEVEIYQNLTTLINEQAIVGNGILFVLKTAQITLPSQVDSLRPSDGWVLNDKVWVDNIDGNSSWGVYNKIEPWDFDNKITLTPSQYIGNDQFGSTVKLSPDGKLLYAAATNSDQGRVNIFLKDINGDYFTAGFIRGNGNSLEKYGKSLATASKENSAYLAVGAPDGGSKRGWVYIYKDQILIQILAPSSASADDLFGESIAFSEDSHYLYIGAPGKNEVYCYAQERLQRYESSSFFFTNGVNLSYSIEQTETDPINLIVNSELKSLNYIPNVEYSLGSFTAGISTLTGTFNQFTRKYSITGSTAVDPSPSIVVAYNNISPTGGTGTGAVINVYRNIGSTLYEVEIVNSGAGYTAGDTLTVLGNLIGGVAPTNNLTLTISAVKNGTNIVFTSAPSSGEKISVITRPDYYKLIEIIPLGAEASGTDNFGKSVVCNNDGSIIAVGASTETVDGHTNAGAVYVYHRTVTEFVTNGVSGTFTPPDALNTIYRVLLDGVLLSEPSDYYISGSSIQFDVYNIPAKGKKLVIETNQFKFDQKITGIVNGSYFEFGSAIALCNTGCNLYVSSPGYTDTDYSSGLVSRYINNGRVYGEITGEVSNPVVTPGHAFVINNRYLSLTGSTVASVAGLINGANIPGVTAEVNDNNQLVITSDVAIAANKLDIKTGVGTVLADLGIDIYSEAQTLKHPEKNGEIFGSKLTVSQSLGVLAVSSIGADIEVKTTFDSGETIFDSGSTGSIDFIKDSGAVYVFDLMTNPYENVVSPSLYAYSQKLVGPNLETNFNFGADIDIVGQYLVVGVTNDDAIISGGGSVYSYRNSENKPGWELIRFKEPRVDIDALSTAFIYNRKTQKLLTFFDYIDPAKGKLLGEVDQELDYKELYDPAGYNKGTRSNININGSYYWSNLFIGKTWFDLSTVSFIDYEQDTLLYRANNWAALFPGSQVNVYEWVESDVLPSQYVNNGGNGIPKYLDDSAYSLTTIVDPGTGIIKEKYYFWVSKKTTVDPVVTNRFLTVSQLENYIIDPKNQATAYLALLAPNSIAVFNVLNELSGQDTILHLESTTARSQNLIHNEYFLLQQGNPLSIIPDNIKLKLKDSLVGATENGEIVPDPNLAAEDKIGINFRPRQSMFVDRLNALRAFIIQLNQVLKNYPILLIAQSLTKLYSEAPAPTTGIDAIADSFNELSYLDSSAFYNGYKVLIPNNSEFQGRWTVYSYDSLAQEFKLNAIQSYKTSLFWNSVDWFSSSYNQGTDLEFVVETFGEILSLTYSNGDYIKVNDNGNGQWLIYEVNDDLTLTLIAAQNATIEFSPSIYDSTLGSGFDSSVFDIDKFDPQAGLEMSKIFDSIVDEILIGDLAVEFNNLFFTVVNFLHSEQIAPDWIFKTSFIDISHNLRLLEQFPNFVKDDQTFYESYINEIKPYRTKLREYVPVYDSIDTATGDWTDFDLQPFYDSNSSVYRSPDVTLAADQSLFTTNTYDDWYENYKYKIVDYIIGNVGLNYTIAPNVEINGGGGTGASAITTINPSTGKLTGVQVISPGSGFTSTPTITINGVGVGASIYPILKNEFNVNNNLLSYNLVRSVTSNIKFDRIDYVSDIVQWSNTSTFSNTVISGSGSNIWVSSGNIVVYNNEAFVVSNAAPTAEEIFDFTRYTKLSSSNVLLRAVDRITAYYNPSNDFTINTAFPNTNLQELIYGTSYPALRVIGPEFRANTFTITSNVLSFNTTGLKITSGNVLAVNFENLGFQIDQPILIEALVPFDFVNNGTFNIVSVSRDSMMLTGGQIETTNKLYLNSSVTVYAGNVITQSNSTANAYVLQDAINTSVIDIVYTNREFEGGASYPIIIDGVATTNYVISEAVGGNVNVKLSDLNLFDYLDANVYSTFLDTELGTRPEDINLVGGHYVDQFSSHAPEELIPGRMYDTLEMRVFSNTVGNTATYGFRIFHPMHDYNVLFPNVPSSNVSITRISANSTTTLAQDLYSSNTAIYVNDASVLPTPNQSEALPGIVFINGEKIHYYQKYDDAKLATATPWSANTTFAKGTLITADIGTLYSNISSNVSGVYFDVTKYASTYTVSSNLISTTTNISIGNVFTVYGNLVGGAFSTNDVTIEIIVTGNANTLVGLSTSGTPAAPLTQIYHVMANVFANANSYINSANVEAVYANTITQLRRGVDGTSLPSVHQANSKVSDSSLIEVVPLTNYFANTASNIFTSGNATAAGNVSYKITLSSPVTVSIGDFVTQFVGNTGNARVLGGNAQSYSLYLSSNVTSVAGNTISQSPNVAVGYILANVTSGNVVSITPNINFEASSNVIYIGGKQQTALITKIAKDVITSNVIVVDLLEGSTLLTAGNVGTRVNLVSVINGITYANANITSITPLGTIFSNGNVTASSINTPVLRSNLIVDYGTGLGIEGSTTSMAQFIRQEPSYIP